MSKRNKRSKKGRKGSSFDSSSRKRGRDEVTGMAIEIEGIGKLQSDQIFGMDAEIVSFVRANSTGPDFWSSVNSFEAEVEFDNNFIVGTAAFETTMPNTSPRQRSRLVLQGEFEYSNGKPTYARVDFMGQSSIGVGIDGKRIGWATVNRIGAEVPNPKSATSWFKTLNSALSKTSDSYAYEIGAEGPEIVSGQYAQVASFGNGRFLYDGWESEPLVTNLL